VDADDQRRSPALERSRDVDAPQRSRVLEALRHEAADERKQPGTVASAIRCGPDMAAEIEIGVVYPRGARDPERGRGKPLTRAREVAEPSLDARAQAIGRQRLAARLDDRKLQGVAGDRIALEPQDAGVFGAEAFDDAVYRTSARRLAVRTRFRARYSRATKVLEPARRPIAVASSGETAELSSASSLSPAYTYRNDPAGMRSPSARRSQTRQSVPGRKPRTWTVRSLPQGRGSRLAWIDTSGGNDPNATGSGAVLFPPDPSKTTARTVAAATVAATPMLSPNRIRLRRPLRRSEAITPAIRSPRCGGGSRAWVT